MTMLSRTATYHAELREQLDSVARALYVQRGLLWLARGFVLGTVVDFGLILWAWIRDTVGILSLPILVAVPVVSAIAVAVGSLIVRHNSTELARRVDRAARLHER